MRSETKRITTKRITIVGRGPVPRHAAMSVFIVGRGVKSRRSCPTEWGGLVTVGRGPVPRHAAMNVFFRFYRRARGQEQALLLYRVGLQRPFLS